MTDRATTSNVADYECQVCHKDRWVYDHTACDLASMKVTMKKLGEKMARERMETLWRIILGCESTRS